MMPNQSSMGISAHDARYTPDLLHIIFSFLDMKSLKNTACVCRVWNDIAVDRIWQALPGLLPLITHFWPPWIYAKNGMMGLDDTEDHELWSRFRAYSRRVRKLDGGIRIVSQAVQNYLETLKTTFSIEKDLEPPLPSIREIVWGAGSPEDTGAQVLRHARHAQTIHPTDGSRRRSDITAPITSLTAKSPSNHFQSRYEMDGFRRQKTGCRVGQLSWLPAGTGRGSIPQILRPPLHDKCFSRSAPTPYIPWHSPL